jgi:hypothetical protein
MAVKLIYSAFQYVHDSAGSPMFWPQCEAFSPYIYSLSKWDDEHHIGNPELDWANIGIAKYLHSCGQYGEAEKLFV